MIPNPQDIERKAHELALWIRPEVSGDLAYWRLRDLFRQALRAAAYELAK